MPGSRPVVLCVEDDDAMLETLRDGFSGADFEVVTAASAEDAVAVVQARDVQAIVTDVRLAGMDGIALCHHFVQTMPSVPVLVVTAFGSLDLAIEAMRAGAFDFLNKPFDLDELALRVKRALEHRSLRDEVARLRLDASTRFPELVGESPAMQEVRALLARYVRLDASVLILGESGTGKDVVARALHAAGPRASGPFVAINCAAMPEALLESELFGHVRGAFTDARHDRRGLFEEAHGGTLFLDEIAEMPAGLQAKLLRVLEARTVRPLGSNREVPFDVRIVAATHRDLDERIAAGAFRQDLFYRLHVLTVDLPPLRARGVDVILLANHVLHRIAARTGRTPQRLSPAASQRLLDYAWPGNVRELANALERAAALAESENIGVDDLPARVRSSKEKDQAPEGDQELVTLEELERRHVLRVLEHTGGNKALAARILGLDRKTLYARLERYRAG